MYDGPAYIAETEGVRVRVRPAYLAGQSEPDENRWVWAYRVEIENRSQRVVQLVSRRWLIVDGHGRIEEVTGEGVVGEQPVIGPGDRYVYTSGCPLPTPSGSMSGTYQMHDETGRSFDAEIPAFSLDIPGAHRVLN